MIKLCGVMDHWIMFPSVSHTCTTKDSVGSPDQKRQQCVLTSSADRWEFFWKYSHASHNNVALVISITHGLPMLSELIENVVYSANLSLGDRTAVPRMERRGSWQVEGQVVLDAMEHFRGSETPEHRYLRSWFCKVCGFSRRGGTMSAESSLWSVCVHWTSVSACMTCMRAFGVCALV